jgi:hypothetical protein
MALSHNRSRMKRIFDYPNHPLKHQQKSTKTVKAQEKKALVQHLEKLERQLKEVNEKLEKLSHIKEHFS